VNGGDGFFDGDKLLCAREVGEMLGISADTVLDRFESGDLPGFRLYARVGAPVRFWLSKILAAIAAWEDAAPGRGGVTQHSTDAAAQAYGDKISPVTQLAARGRNEEER
jgi:hypothetical protein